VLAWAVPEHVASVLNAEYDTSFLGRRDTEVDFVVTVDRSRQRQAIACHVSQSTDNPVLWRRLELLGSSESLRWLGLPVGVVGAREHVAPASPDSDGGAS
jgi:LmbE family N-acetylglucosaminyl deacetylase